MIDVRQRLQLPSGASTTYCSLPHLERLGVGSISRLPVSVRIVLESVLRHVDGRRIREEDVEALARWQPGAARTAEVPFVVGRVLLQNFTGVPLLVDLAAMRSAIARRGLDVERVQPSVADESEPLSLRCIATAYFNGSCLRQAIEQEMEIQHAGIRPPLLEGLADAVVVQRTRAAEPPGQTLLRADIVAREHMQTAKAA